MATFYSHEASPETKAQIAGYVERSRAALKIIEKYDQKRVDELAAAIVYTLSRPAFAKKVADMAWEETQMGLLEVKVNKLTGLRMHFNHYKTWPTCGIVENNPDKAYIKIAKPLGVLAAICPSTNPEGTPAFQSLLAIRARDTLIVGAHKKSYKTTKYVVDAIRAVMKANGAPEDFIICVDNPSIETSQELMRQCDVVMATGAADMVRAAHSSGKPAIGVGAGNCVSIVDKDVNIDEASSMSVMDKSAGDRASGCSTLQSVAIHADIYDEYLAQLQKKGGYLCTPEEKERLEQTVWPNKGSINREIVAKPVEHIAKLCGLTIPEGTKFIMCEDELDHVGPDHPLCREKISLILTVYKWENFDDAINLINKCHEVVGKGHSCNILSNNEEHIMRVGMETYTVRVSVNQPNAFSNAGGPNNGLNPTFSIGCGSWGGNSVSENVNQNHYLNFTYVHRPLIPFPFTTGPKTGDEVFEGLLDNVTVFEDISECI